MRTLFFTSFQKQHQQSCACGPDPGDEWEIVCGVGIVTGPGNGWNPYNFFTVSHTKDGNAIAVHVQQTHSPDSPADLQLFCQKIGTVSTGENGVFNVYGDSVAPAMPLEMSET